MSSPTVDPHLIRELAALLEETGLSEIEWESEGQRVRVARSNAAAAQAPRAPNPSASEPIAVEAQVEPAPPRPAPDHAAHPGAVTSPMVGTAYLSPEPGANPFVRSGDNVTEGQTLLIVEAMKTMNPIAAPRAGTVSQVLVSNGAPVEYGEVLLIID